MFSASLTGARWRVHRDAKLGGVDFVDGTLLASQQRVAYFLEATSSGPNEEFTYLEHTASAHVGARELIAFGGRAGYEQLRDVAGQSVLTTEFRRVGGRPTMRSYVRDFAARDPRRTPVGPRISLARGESSSLVEVRLTSAWLALLRRGRHPAISVYARRSGKRAWKVSLPSRRKSTRSTPYDRAIAWDLAEDGTLAVALEMSARGAKQPRKRQILGWAAPHSRFRRVAGSVLVGEPFVLNGGQLTYARASGARGFGSIGAGAAATRCVSPATFPHQFGGFGWPAGRRGRRAQLIADVHLGRCAAYLSRALALLRALAPCLTCGRGACRQAAIRSRRSSAHEGVEHARVALDELGAAVRMGGDEHALGECAPASGVAPEKA